jgi:hypothetical protein
MKFDREAANGAIRTIPQALGLEGADVTAEALPASSGFNLIA